MEFPPYPNDEDDDITHVYNLYHLAIDPVTKVQSRPRATNFSGKKTMQKHIMELVLKCDQLDDHHRSALVAFKETYYKSLLTAKDKTFEAFVKTFRHVQLENSKPLGFDIYWDEEPQVLL